MTNSNIHTLTIAQHLGIEAVNLRDTTKDFDGVWADFVERLTQSVEAVRDGSTDAPMIRGVLRKSNHKARTPYFVIGYGAGNYWFPNGVHKKGTGLDISVHRNVILELTSPKILDLLKEYVRAKFEQEQVKGQKGRKVRAANTDIGFISLNRQYLAANDDKGATSQSSKSA